MVKWWKRFKWHRERRFGIVHSIIATIWFYSGKLRNQNIKRIRKGYDISTYIPFAPGAWRQKNCAECRSDKARQYVAEVSDEQSSKAYAKTVQHLNCTRCKKRRAWWWFAKLPLDEREDVEVINHGGKAW